MSVTTAPRLPRTAWDVPTGILGHHPPQAAPGREVVWPQRAGGEAPTYLHPLVVVTAAAGYAWLMLSFWVVFAGQGYTDFALFVAGLISCIMLGLIAALGTGGRAPVPWQRPWRSFREFLHGDVEIWNARISGREAFIHLAGLAWILALLATAFSVIIAIDGG